MVRLTGLVALALLASNFDASAVLAAGKVPMKPGTCVATTIKEIGSRLEGVPDSGSALIYADGIPGVSYDTVDGVVHSKPGDKVELCLVSLPENCPKGDDRGKVYATVNLRTQAYWELPDAEHSCGGA